ncbi:hypothetical protein [Streptomyces sp. NPDC001828]|uniref:hypothetical protein n=1 Tax=Streptomyces sp. NPDC001828 TaxID=3364615 RepID=UPI0036B8E4F9
MAASLLLLALSSCSHEPSVPSIPKSLCWGAFTGSSVTPLLPDGDSASLKNDGRFDAFEAQSNAYCTLFVDDHAALIVSVERRNSGKGTDWNGFARTHGTPVQAGDEGFVWDRGAGAVFLCERPDLPRGPALPPSQKYVELELSADRAPTVPRTREVLTVLLKQYVQFATRELKCANK